MTPRKVQGSVEASTPCSGIREHCESGSEESLAEFRTRESARSQACPSQSNSISEPYRTATCIPVETRPIAGSGPRAPTGEFSAPLEAAFSGREAV